MIDSHCHLTDPRLESQLSQVVARAASAGVDRLVTVGTTPLDGAAALDVCAAHSNVRFTVGIHPNHSGDFDLDDVRELRALVDHPRLVALGEMGLDYHYDRAPRDHQAAVFRRQLSLAREATLPVVIHSRESTADTLTILAEFPEVKCVFHCFTGTPAEAQAIADRGYYVGFTGPLTFRKNDALREACRLVPRDRLMIETDAPYLSPEPHRSQKVNEPALVIHVAQTMAQVHGVSLAEIDELTTANTLALYRWL